MKKFLFLFLLSATSFTHLLSQNVHSDYFDGQIYIKISEQVQLKYLCDKASIEDFPFLKKVEGEYDIQKLRASFYFAKEKHLNHVLRIYFNDANSVEQFIKYLQEQPEIEYAEKVPLHRKSLVPNDLGANNTGSNGQWFLHKINAQQAWDISVGSSSVKVAVVDDAVQITHPDLDNACIAGRDVSDNDNDPNPPNTSYSHGTHVAGIVGAETNNSTGIASIGFGISIIPIKATNDPNFITDGYEGVVWAIDNGADVINMSWGGSGGSQTGQNIMNSGNNAGVVLVAASGNDNVSTTFFPAGFNHVISVASTTSTDAKSSFSNYGTWIDISAPGSSIRSTLPSTTYGINSGTSMASPLVAGLCGLMLSANPNLSPQEVLDCLQLSADNINSQNGSFIGQLGGGRINALAAMQCASASALVFDASVLNILAPLGSTCNSTIVPQITIRNTGQSVINSLTFTVQLDALPNSNFTWNGSLASQGTALVSLPLITANIGNHSLTICSAIINGSQADGFAGNNCKTTTFSVVSSTGISLPFIESFESGSFNTNGWTTNNPDNGLGWEVITTAGTLPGDKSARIPFYSYSSTGQRDALITPTLNFGPYTNISMSFSHAYRRYDASSTDSLILSISTDCGETYPTRIFVGGENGQGSFATAAISTTDFIPTTANDWCTGPVGSDCIQIDLNAFSGASSVRIKFEGYNNYGNNLYLDNINIDGTIAGTPAIADFSTVGSAVLCAGNSVLFSNLSGNQPDTYLWTFNGGNPSTSTNANPTITYNSPGVYEVSLIASNAFGSDTEVKTSYITVESLPAIGITANPTEICKGTPTTLTGFGASSYEWSPVIAISSNIGEVITANPSQSTTYTLTGISAAGCESTADFTLVVNDLPEQPVIENLGGVLSSTEALAYQWYFNDLLISDANLQTYQPLQNGEYKVEVFNEAGCSIFSSPIVFSNVLSVSETQNLPITLSPNPASDFIRIQGIEEFEFSLFQINGQLVSAGYSLDGLIDLKKVAEGFYFIRIISKKDNITKPIVVTRSIN